MTPNYIKDRRIKTVVYDPNDVVRLTVQTGRGVVIEFDPSEEILFVNNGHAESWEVAKKKNMLYLGSKSYGASTNLIVQTSKRQYFIDLIMVKKNGSYKLKYTYNGARPIFWPKNKKHNYAYYGFGDKELKPALAYDDGYFTYFVFPSNLDQPTIYKITPDGSEAIVDFHLDGNTTIVHETSQRFNIRLGKKVLGIINKGRIRSEYNSSRTSNNIPRKIRR